MNGRLENEIKIEKSILKNLESMPSYVTDWFYLLKASDKTMSSCRDFVNKVRLFLLFISDNPKDVKLNDFGQNDVIRFFVSIKTKEKNGEIIPTSDSYQQAMWCCMNNFFNFLYKTKQIETNYMDLIKKPKNRDLDRINNDRVLLTERDFKKIIKCVRDGDGNKREKIYNEKTKSRDLAIIMLFMQTGMRKTALMSINVSDIDFDNETIVVVDKGDKLHKYYLDESVLDALDEWIDEREYIVKDGEDALFVSSNGTRMCSESIYNVIEKYTKIALGKSYSPHKLRGGFINIVYTKTKDIEKVRRMVGHSNISTTQRYISTDNKCERYESAKIMGKLLNV